MNSYVYSFSSDSRIINSMLFYVGNSLKTLFISQELYKKYHAQKRLKFALVVELGQLKFIYTTVVK